MVEQQLNKWGIMNAIEFVIEHLGAILEAYQTSTRQDKNEFDSYLVLYFVEG